MPDQRPITLTLPASMRRRRSVHPLLRCTRGIVAWVHRCAQRSAGRRALAEFGDWQLRDIGISRAEAGTEAAKWFWQT